jgi:hypothetical protein
MCGTVGAQGWSRSCTTACNGCSSHRARAPRIRRKASQRSSAADYHGFVIKLMWLSILCSCRLKKCPENGILKEMEELRSLSLLHLSRALGTSSPNWSILMNACCKSTIVIRLLYVFFSFIGMIKYACCIGWLFDLFACNQYRLMYTEQSVSYVDCVKLAGQYMHSLCMVSNYYDPFDNLIKSSGCP